MARYEFGHGIGDFVVRPSDGLWGVGAGVDVTFYDASTGGTQYTDLRDASSNPISNVTTDEQGALPTFFGPDGILGMWADAGGSSRAWIEAHSVTSGASTAGSVRDWKNVRDFGAVGDGVTDDTAALQGAVDAAALTNTIVYLPTGTYLVSAPISLPPGEGMSIFGAGWDSRVKLKGGSNCYVFAMTGADTRATMRDMTIDGNCLEQGTTGSSGGVYGAGAVACRFDNVHFIACRDNGLYLGPQTGGAFGHNNRIVGCLFDQSMSSTGPGRGIHMDSNDENQILTCDFEYLGGAGTRPAAIYDQAGTQFIIGCNFVNGAHDVRGVHVQDAKSTKIVACNFDGLAGDNVFIAGQRCVVEGNTLFSPGIAGTAGQATAIYLEYASAENVIVSNVITSAPGAGVSRGAIREASDGGGGHNTIGPNRIITDGSWGYAALDLSGAGSRVVANTGGGPAGDRPSITEGTNARMGRATLVAGTVTVATTAVAATSEVFLTCQTPGGTPGFLRVSARTAGVSFTIQSSSGTDTSVVAWMIVEPA
jgi:hypothetical protein